MKDQDDERWSGHDATVPKRNSFLAGWGTALVTVFIGATIVANIMTLRRRLESIRNIYSEGISTRPGSSTRQRNSSQQPGRSQQSQQQGRPSFYEVDAAETRRIWAEHIKEIERMRRRQEAFDRERMRYKRNYDSWQERHGDTWDWRWHESRWEWQGESERVRHEESADNWRQESQRTQRSRPSNGVANQQHYVALGLDPSRLQPYTQAEIKAAFRAKALEVHPDTSPKNKAEAEKKFQQVMDAYNTLKSK